MAADAILCGVRRGSHIDIVKLLCAQKVDMCKEDQDGTAPAHIAAACGHLEVIQYLHEQGVSVKHPGSIYDYDLPVGSQCLTKVTPLQIATHFKQCEVAQFIEGVLGAHHSLSLLERAERVGVAARLKQIPTQLLVAAESGTAKEISSAKRQIHATQKSNQQIVSRAEQKHLKQSQLPF